MGAGRLALEVPISSRAILLAGLAFALPGCVAKQRVALDCVPREVTVFVDGRALEKNPEDIDLRKDEPHVVYFKGGGYKPQTVIFESEEVDGAHRLTPSDVCSQTVFAEFDPKVQIQIDPDATVP